MSAERASNLPFVSVVIPVLNSATEVEPCVAALKAQTYPAEQFEIIVVDNGSTDETIDRLRAQPGVQVLLREARGRSRALNHGLEQACGEIICTTDISCRAEPQWISEVVASFDDPSIGCVAGEIKLLKTHDNFAIRFQERANYMSPMGACERMRPPYLPYADGANASFRRAVFDAIGPFEETFIKAADVEICYRLLFLTNYKIAFNPHATVWEAGEESLRDLLKQRYRIGLGNVLMRARFPALYAASRLQHRSLKARYWLALRLLGTCAQVSRLCLTSLWDVDARESLAGLGLSLGMKTAQRLGRLNGRRYLQRASRVPTPIDDVELAEAYWSGRWAPGDRIVIR